jgi:hypothetical protein
MQEVLKLDNLSHIEQEGLLYGKGHLLAYFKTNDILRCHRQVVVGQSAVREHYGTDYRKPLK